MFVQESLQQYREVFSWLLCLKRVSLAMQQQWSDLSCTTASANRASQQNAAAPSSRASTFAQPAAEAASIQGVVAAASGYSTGQAQGQDQHAGHSRRQEIRQRINTLQLFRHEAAQFAGALLTYMQSQLLGTCWQQVQSDLQVCHA